jgi:hypothetical protein
METDDFYVKFFIKSKLDAFEWILVGVYGASRKHLLNFHVELVRICKSETLPVLVGGNFNTIGWKEEEIMMILMLAGLLFLMLSLGVLIYGEIILGLVGGSYPPTKS